MARNTSTTPAPAAEAVTEAATPAPAFPTVEDYRAADVKGKAAIRRDLTAAAHAAIMAGDLLTGQAALAAMKAITEDRGAPKADTFDWHGTIAARAATFRLAADLLEAGSVTPEGTPEGFAYVAPMGPAQADTETATRLAGSPLRRATKHDLRGLLIRVFEDVEAGVFMKAGDLVKAVADVADGDYVPSSGAVVAALASKKGIPGVRYVPADKGRGINAGGMKA